MAGVIRKLARRTARAFLVAALAAPLMACDLIMADRLAGLPQGEQWTALPMRALLSRPTVSVEALEFCRSEACGYDAVIGRFTASGQEADRLRRSLVRPDMLAALLARPVGAPAKAATARVDRFDLAGWQGVRIVIAGPKKRAHGIILESERAGRFTFVVVVTDRPDVATALARAAAG